jgi:polyisoprenoid-binding protein YceI
MEAQAQVRASIVRGEDLMRNLILAAAVALAAPAIAQTPGTADVSRATAGTYKVDAGHTQVLFTVNHLGFSEYTGQFIQPTGTLVLDPANAANDKVEISFKIANMSTTTPLLVEHLSKPEFFDAAKFPDAKFVSTKVTVTGKTATIAGNLTLKGVTKPVILATRFVGAGTNPMAKKTNIGFAATTTIKRSDFGISAFVPMVSDEVKLVINAAFEAQ